MGLFSPFARMFFCKSLHINENLKAPLASIGLSEFQDFVDYSAGKLVSRPSKRFVRILYLNVAGKRKKYFIKQACAQSLKVVLKAWCRLQIPHSNTARELLLLELFRNQGIPVMNPVAWGEFTVFGWPVRGFIVVNEVVGKEFVEVYQHSSLRCRRRLMWLHGELMGTLHQKGIQSKVHPRDLICISQDYSTFRKCLVVIDRERGLTYPVNLSLKQRGKTLAEIWIKGAFTIGRGERSELLAFLAGYFSASGMRGSQRDQCAILVQWVMLRATEILANDDRYSSLLHGFKEKYGIVQSRVRG